MESAGTLVAITGSTLGTSGPCYLLLCELAPMLPAALQGCGVSLNSVHCTAKTRDGTRNLHPAAAKANRGHLTLAPVRLLFRSAS